MTVSVLLIGIYKGGFASERVIIMRNQGFIHPATLVFDELDYNIGYQIRMDNSNEKTCLNKQQYIE
jgi:hypothetical protein